MSHIKISIKVPGKVMLCGEYTVLKGCPSLATSLDTFFEIELTSSANQKPSTIELNTPLWNAPKIFYKEDFKNSRYTQDEVFTSAVSEGLKHFPIDAPISVNIKSCFPITYGIGSSSALRLGVIFGLQALNYKISDDKNRLSFCDDRWSAAKIAFLHQKADQEYASGYDIVTQVFGGLVSFKHESEDLNFWPNYAERHGTLANHPLDQFIHLFVSDKGAPTKSTMKDSIMYLDKHHLWDALKGAHQSLYTVLLDSYKTLTPLSLSTQKCIFSLCEDHRKIFKNAPSFPTALDEALSTIKDIHQDWHYKTSGAGGEDAIIVFGSEEHLTNVRQTLNHLGWSLMPYKFGSRGLTCHD